MKRRGFLGMFGGAVVAGPSMAQNALAQLPKGLGSAAMSLPPSGYPGAYGQAVKDCAEGESGVWELKHIKRIRRLLSGQKTDEEREAEAIERRENRINVIGQEIACLRSISGTAKLNMYERKILEIRDMRQQYYWGRELADLMKAGFK